MNITHTEDVDQLRKKAYPPVEDFIDAMYWDANGDKTLLQAYYDKMKAVKDKYPKP